MILAKFEKTQQVSEDSWRVVWIEKLFTSNVPIEIIKRWAIDNGCYNTINGKNQLKSLIISEPEL